MIGVNVYELKVGKCLNINHLFKTLEDKINKHKKIILHKTVTCSRKRITCRLPRYCHLMINGGCLIKTFLLVYKDFQLESKHVQPAAIRLFSLIQVYP